MDMDVLFNPGQPGAYDRRLYKFIACFLSFLFTYSAHVILQHDKRPLKCMCLVGSLLLSSQPKVS